MKGAVTASAALSGEVSWRLAQTMAARAALGAPAATDTRSIIGVSTTPGQTARTEIRRSASSAAADRVRLSSAALLAAYGAPAASGSSPATSCS